MTTQITQQEIRTKLEDLKAQKNILKCRIKNLDKDIEHYEKLSKAEITYETKTCQYCKKEYIFQNIQGFLSKNIVRFLRFFDGKLATIYFGSACDNCVKQIWENSVNKLKEQGIITIDPITSEIKLKEA